MRTLTASLVLALIAGGELWAQNTLPRRAVPPSNTPEAVPGAQPLMAESCLVKWIHSARIPAQVEGVLTELKVEEGQDVEAGQLIAVIDDEQAKLMLALREAEEMEALLTAENDVNLRDAVASEASARAEYKSYEELLKTGSIPFWEAEKKRLDADRQKLRIELAELESKQAKTTLIAKKRGRELAELEVEKRQVKAPFAGYIETRVAQQGEWVQPGSPLLEVVKMDQLRVEGDVDALKYPQAVVRGAPVKVYVKTSADSSDAKVFDGRIGFVSTQIDLANRRRIWVDIENVRQGEDWLIKPGMEATIVFQNVPELASR
ncbi:efflux RND transporter periplasmic adaptor subunit [Roseimaritima sediminicola]|uniref:efflux RND transporter periplasmic adaptor subunit n=1 Tax=Roseimaritima sediminicola TaxID=2662066 RepID=UPI0013866CC1|nr:HlyD family efflux transporter periplasmic adaptor subunit [Roseimaritima sediminicola]